MWLERSSAARRADLPREAARRQRRSYHVLKPQFLLTGSANLLTAPKIKEALTGRAEYLTLWPLSQAEIAGAHSNFVDALLTGQPPIVTGAPVGRDAFVDLVARGGYPEARLRAPSRRRVWYRDHIRSLVERDLRDRQQSGRDELDIVLETPSGEIAAAEVKAAATVDPADYRALTKLRDARGPGFIAGVVFFTGRDTLPLTDRIWAVPISGLWA